jgi:small subunit ribosomal protein S7e
MFNKADLSEFEQLVQANLVELEKTDLKSDLRGISFSSAKQIDIGQKSAILISVPVPMLPRLHKVQPRLVRELEKKFSECHVLFVAQRRIIGKNDKSMRQKRPKSRTVTSVHEAILHDLVYPTEIVGKRTRVLVDGSKISKMYFVVI